MRPQDARLVPLVVIDTSERPDLDSLFASYTPEAVGNVAIQWGRRDGAPKGTVTLNIKFIAPVEQLLMLDFEIVRQGLLVDGILRTRELYLQGIRSNDADQEARSPKIRVVVPDTKFDGIWQELLMDELVQRSKALGATEHHARFLAQESIRRWRTAQASDTHSVRTSRIRPANASMTRCAAPWPTRREIGPDVADRR